MPVVLALQRDRQRHRDRVGLPEIVHVELVDDVDALDCHAGRRHHRPRAAPAAAMRRSSAAQIEAVEHEIDGLHLIVAEIGDDAAERRGDAGEARDHRALQSNLLDQRARMQRAASAERHGGEFRRIVSALDRDQPDGAGHARLGDAHDRFRRLQRVEAERRPHMRGDGVACRRRRRAASRRSAARH